MNTYWFDTKRIFGIGWRPVSIEGWLVIGLYIFGVYEWIKSHPTGTPKFLGVIGLTIILLLICCFKAVPGE
jgi:hypothetical protein